jgi:hypothetical protein
MNVLSTRIHGILDYVLALLMISTPWLMKYEEGSNQQWLIISIGCVALLYSLCTDYEFGFLEELEVRTHLLLDFLVGILLILSPWLFGFYDKAYAPYIVLGVIEILSTVFTTTGEKVFQNISSPNKRQTVRSNS